jgi:hypothetical protein
MIVINVDNEKDEDIFIFGCVFELCEGDADGEGVEEDYRIVSSVCNLEGPAVLHCASKKRAIFHYAPVVVKRASHSASVIYGFGLG